MRMWKVNPELLCNKHLLGEHVEMHMFLGCVKKNKNISGYISGGLVEVGYVFYRHNELAIEMLYRHFNHNSFMDYRDLSTLVMWRHINHTQDGHVDSEASLKELARRCVECRKRIIGIGGE